MALGSALTEDCRTIYSLAHLSLPLATALFVFQDETEKAASAIPDLNDGKDAQAGGAASDAPAAQAQADAHGDQRGTAAPEQTNAQQAKDYQHRKDTNPLRQLGDALRAWHDRLNVQDLPPDEASEDAPAPAPPQTETADADTYAYTQDEEAGELQAVGAATQEQLAAQEAAPGAEEQDGEDAVAEAEKDAAAEEEEENGDTAPPVPVEEVAVTAMTAAAPTAGDGPPEADAEELLPTDAAAAADSDGESEDVEMDHLAELEPTAAHARPSSASRAPDAHLGAAATTETDEPSAEDDAQDETERAASPPVLTAEEERLLRARLEEELDTLQRQEAAAPGAAQAMARAQALWQRYEQLTGALSSELCEQLRLVLTESQASKMRGDFRTGKRLNMRKIIPYIASQFRKDKIWLRRTKPSKREYQVLLAVDDSRSMALYHSRQMALEALCTIAGALGKLEVGELGVLGFGERPALIHRLDEPFTPVAGARCLQRLSFAQQRTAMGDFLDQAASVLSDARSGRARQPDLVVSQLLFVLSDSDNLYQEGQAVVERGVRRLKDQGVFVVFVILDAPEKEHSVMEQKSVSFVGGRVVTEDYMDRFRDKNYIVLRDLGSLPERLGDALRQWFEMVSSE